MIKRKRKKLIILSLAIAMLFMGIGYALLSKNLDVTLTSESNGRWDIRIDTVSVKTVNGNAVSRSFTHDGLTATFAVDLYTTGDYVEYEVKVKNFGNIAAKLTSKTPTVPETNGVIGFTDDAVIDEVLAPGASKVITVKISVDSSSDTDILNATYSLALVYSQFTTDQPSYDASSYPPGGNGSSSTPTVEEPKKLRILSASGYPELTSENMNTVSFGDIIGFGTSDIESNEQFYVVGGNGKSTFKLLSRYLINVGSHQKKSFESGQRDTRGLQDKNIGYTKSRSSSDLNSEINANGGQDSGYLFGTVPFSTTAFWWDSSANDGSGDYVSGYSDNSSAYSNSLIKSYVNNYATVLNRMGFGKAIADLTGAAPTITGSIFSIQEVAAMCSISVDSITLGTEDTGNCPSFLFDTAYWLSSIKTYLNYTVVGAGTLFGDSNNDMIFMVPPDVGGKAVGIRPVITISLS